jgi:hypothetical protein
MRRYYRSWCRAVQQAWDASVNDTRNFGVTRIAAYVDGFNLYNGMHDARGRRGLWLNLESLLASLLRADQKLVVVHYFTALVRGTGHEAQRTYLDALHAHCPRTRLHVGPARSLVLRPVISRWRAGPR